jgi:hypothetical protein
MATLNLSNPPTSNTHAVNKLYADNLIFPWANISGKWTNANPTGGIMLENETKLTPTELSFNYESKKILTYSDVMSMQVSGPVGSGWIKLSENLGEEGIDITSASVSLMYMSPNTQTSN